jgi:transcriptional regulator with XRE-family HTH domain
MTVKAIRECARQLRSARAVAGAWERDLQEKVSEFLMQRGGTRDMARELGVSAQYICDIRHKRRKISNPFLKTLLNKFGRGERVGEKIDG